MTGRTGNAAGWYRATILVRGDILKRAHEKKTDISRACNEALAQLLDIDLRQVPLGEIPEPDPVLVVSEGPAEKGAPARRSGPSLAPVLNAEDHAAVKDAMQAAKAKKTQKPKTAAPPTKPPAEGPKPAKAETKTETAPAPKEPAQKTRTPKRVAGSVIRTFVAGRISREAPEGSAVPKEELYELFVRFCRDRKENRIPDQRSFGIALKNQLAFTEESVAGIPCWKNIRVK